MSQDVTKCHTLLNPWYKTTFAFYVWILLGTALTITITRLVSILLCFHAVSLRLLLNFWHSNDPEPKVHFFLLESKSESKSHLSPVFCP